MNKQSIRLISLAAVGLILTSAGTIYARAVAPVPQEPAEMNVAAPELVGGPWLNTPNEKPITLASRKGKVTVVEFWTFG